MYRSHINTDDVSHPNLQRPISGWRLLPPGTPGRRGMSVSEYIEYYWIQTPKMMVRLQFVNLNVQYIYVLPPKKSQTLYNVFMYYFQHYH